MGHAQTPPTDSWQGRVVRGAVRRQWDGREGQRASSPHPVRCGGRTRTFLLAISCSKVVFPSCPTVLASSCACTTRRRSPTVRMGSLWRDARCGLQTWREFGVESVWVQTITSHQALDDMVDGSSARDVLGNEQADEFARKGAELHVPDKSDVATLAARHRLVKRVAATAWRSSRNRARCWGFPSDGEARHAFKWYEGRWRCSHCLVSSLRGDVVVGTVGEAQIHCPGSRQSSWEGRGEGREERRGSECGRSTNDDMFFQIAATRCN